MPLLILVVVIAVWLKLSSGTTGASAYTVPDDEDEQGSTGQPVPSPDYQSPGDQRSIIAQAIAHLEGYGIAGNAPTRDNNPGDLRSAAGMIGIDSSVPGGNARFATAADGWDALGGWISSHAAKHPDWDFYDLEHYFVTGDTLGQSQPGFANPDDEAEYIAAQAGVDPTTPVSTVVGGS